MSGTDGEEEFKVLGGLEGDEDLGLFGDLSAFEGLGIEEEVAGDQSSESGNVHCPHCLGKYKNPRVLSCLHVLCESCLKELLMSSASSENEDDGESLYCGRNGKNRNGSITCPQCRQETTVGERGLSSLPLDPIYQRAVGIDGLSGLICTSCKANEEAVAKCMVCDNLLCSNCNTAHKYMRLFENHKVVTFEEMSQPGQSVAQVVKKSPAACPRHPNENFRYYCFSCQMMSCGQCLKTQHGGLDHRTEHLSEAESRCREELIRISEEMTGRQNVCRVNANRLEKMLGQLQQQHDVARDAVDRVHAQYVALLDKRRDQLLEELANLHTKQELSVMESCERVDRIRDRIQTALRYTKNVLGEAEGSGLLSVHQCIKSQMQMLHNAATRPADEGLQVLLKFEANPLRFEELLQSSYGYFVNPGHATSGSSSSSSSSSCAGLPSKPVSSLGLPTPSSTPQPPSPTHSSPLEAPVTPSVGFTHLTAHLGPPVPSALIKNDLSSNSNLINALGSAMDRQLHSQSDHMALHLSSFGASVAGYHRSLVNSTGPGVPGVSGGDLSSALDPHMATGMTSIQEYNLQRLASLAASKSQEAECPNPAAPGNQGPVQARLPPSHPSSNRQSQSSPIGGHPSLPSQPFTLADILTGDVNAASHALNNLQALAKLGSQNSLGLNLSLDSLGASSHMGSLSNGGGHHVQGMGTNLGLLVNGSSPASSPLPMEASLLASALSAPPFVPSSVNHFYGATISSQQSNAFRRNQPW